MSMQVKGTLQQILKLESGVSKAGKEWKKQDFVLVTNEQFPKKLKFIFRLNRAILMVNGITILMHGKLNVLVP